MARVNFYLNNKTDSEGYSTILLYFSFKTLRIPVTTNENVLNKAWNKNTQRVRLSYAEGKSINDRLDDIELKVKKMFREDFSEIAPRRGTIKEKIQNIISPPDEFGSKDFISFAKYYASSSLKKKETKKNYFQTINHLVNFRNQNIEYRKNSISFNQIDLDFYNQFYNYLERKMGLGKNTIGTHFKNIKVFMRQSFERNLQMAMPF